MAHNLESMFYVRVTHTFKASGVSVLTADVSKSTCTNEIMSARLTRPLFRPET